MKSIQAIQYSTKVDSLPRRAAMLSAAMVMIGALFVSGVASAASLSTDASTTVTTPAASTSANTNTSATTSLTATQQQHLQNIITKGSEEINRRLTTLETLTSKVNAATHLTASDKATLSNEVSTSTQGLTGLKAQLDADTTVSAAHTDAESIYTEYRVYALVAPKVGLIKVADDQQVVQVDLTALAQKLQSRITAEQQVGKDVSSLQSELNNMNSSITAAHSISSGIESGVINLQPTDYNSNHAVLTGDNTQLKNAHSDDLAARNDARSIISSLESM